MFYGTGRKRPASAGNGARRWTSACPPYPSTGSPCLPPVVTPPCASQWPSARQTAIHVPAASLAAPTPNLSQRLGPMANRSFFLMIPRPPTSTLLLYSLLFCL